MYALSLHQPWASLMALGAKTIETRSWSAPESLIGQRFAIHACQAFPKEYRRIAYEEPFRSALREFLHVPYHRWDHGVILCTVRLVACHPIRFSGIGMQKNWLDPDGLSEQERYFGNYRSGRYAWITSELYRLPKPIPARGYQRLWRCDLPEIRDRQNK